MRERPVQSVIDSLRTTEGAGLPIRRLFPVAGLPHVDPFLLMDHMGPVHWGPGEATGVPDHPHRGFETVTYLLEGKFQHKDSAGHSGILKAGDVQWMTAGRGVVHSEMPAEDFRVTGGVLHGFQLWVNLPKKDKMMAPRYQEIPAASIPTAGDTSGRVTVRVIAGESLGARAVIDTRIPITYLHLSLRPGGHVSQPVPEDQVVFAYVVSGHVAVGPAPTVVREGQSAMFGAGSRVSLALPDGAQSAGEVLLLAGRPLLEPIARYGPFVMNTQDEIRQAIQDYEEGRIG